MIGVISRAPVPQVSSSFCGSACVDMSVCVCVCGVQRDFPPYPSLPPHLPPSLLAPFLPASLLPALSPRPTHSRTRARALSLCLSLSLSLSLSARARAAVPDTSNSKRSGYGLAWRGGRCFKDLAIHSTSTSTCVTTPGTCRLHSGL